ELGEDRLVTAARRVQVEEDLAFCRSVVRAPVANRYAPFGNVVIHVSHLLGTREAGPPARWSTRGAGRPWSVFGPGAVAPKAVGADRPVPGGRLVRPPFANREQSP